MCNFGISQRIKQARRLIEFYGHWHRYNCFLHVGAACEAAHAVLRTVAYEVVLRTSEYEVVLRTAEYEVVLRAAA